ncbi:hypothetical protein LTS14_005003 [Recurvomyces mirabilis]|nr:hypothetical protein LTS14_005003 [Recurvomyces mirabilis]
MRELCKAKPPKSLEHCVGAGEPLNSEVINQWQDMTGCEIKDGYGQTESTLLCGNLVGHVVRPGSMGKPIPGLPFEIIDQDGESCPTGEEGDIAIATTTKAGDMVACIFDGYISATGDVKRAVRHEARPGRSVHPRQWFLTGDRAYRDEDGYIWFVGRADDVINASGYRIGPFEIESVLKRHPAVQESAVVASPDAARGDVVKAFIVRNKEFLSADVSQLAAELQRFCREMAAPYKYPRKIEFVCENFLPKTISGKIRRVELRQLEVQRARQMSKL